jgi:hypothetical protein
MRILSRKDFMLMPPGTIYASGVQHAYSEWKLKNSNCGNDDWVFTSLNYAAINCKSSDELLHKLDNMSDRGMSYPISFDETQREGDYDCTHFVVLELSDIYSFIELFTTIANLR